jgi:hypothetical protein
MSSYIYQPCPAPLLFFSFLLQPSHTMYYSGPPTIRPNWDSHLWKKIDFNKPANVFWKKLPVRFEF